MSLPHDGVCTRLGVSPIHGIGVFAIRFIPKGTRIFPGDNQPLTWVNAEEVISLPPEIKKFYQDFCVVDGAKYGCPHNFNEMTIAWYLNDSDNPNVVCDDNFDFFANRDIQNGEELTVNYKTYSDE